MSVSWSVTPAIVGEAKTGSSMPRLASLRGAGQQFVGEDHGKHRRGAGDRPAPALDRHQRVLDRRTGVDDEVGCVGGPLAGRVRRRLVEIALAVIATTNMPRRWYSAVSMPDELRPLWPKMMIESPA